jgi:competence CoiA-like predicted nuclease
MRLNLIPEVFDPATGGFIAAAEYFDEEDEHQKDVIHIQRRELLRAKRKGEKIWVCALCQEPVYIAGGLGQTRRRYHFKHFIDTPPCPYQTRGTLDQATIRKIKYNGAKESPLHRDMKTALAALLERDPAVNGEVQVEQTFFHQDQGKVWRRPDVACAWNDLRLVMEIQISSDFVDVIVGREDFYREQGVFILWIFNKLDPAQFTARDISVGNQKNCFVFNERVKILSEKTGVLTFECHYKRPTAEQGQIIDVWECRDVTLRDLTFDQERMQAFCHDYDRAERELQLSTLLKDFERYWCRERPRLNAELVDTSGRDWLYEERFETLCGIEPGWSRSKVAKVINVLYAIRNTPAEKASQPVENYRVNLFALVNVMFESRKPFLWVLLWALEVYGHGDSFRGRIAFKNKVAQYKNAAKDKDPAYQRQTRYDPLFKLLFPQLVDKLRG